MGLQKRGKDSRSKPLRSIVAWLSGDNPGALPNGFVLENVEGMCVGSAVKRFKRIIRELSRHYDIKRSVLDSQHWVPQSRRRVYVVGIKKSQPHSEHFSFPGGA